MKGGYPSDNDNVAENLSTQAVYHRNKQDLKNIVFQKQSEKKSKLLSEDNIKDLDN